LGTTDRGTAAVAAAGIAYTLTYPFGLLGPTLVIALLRRVLRVRMTDELAVLEARDRLQRPPIDWLDLEVTEAAHTGIPLKDHARLRADGIRLSRLLRDGRMSVPQADTTLHVGDVIRVVGPAPALAGLVAAMGRRASINLDLAKGDVAATDLLV